MRSNPAHQIFFIFQPAGEVAQALNIYLSARGRLSPHVQTVSTTLMFKLVKSDFSLLSLDPQNYFGIIWG